MKAKIITTIRLILMCFMLYGIYRETGIITTIFAAAVGIYIELNNLTIDNIRKILKFRE